MPSEIAIALASNPSIGYAVLGACGGTVCSAVLGLFVYGGCKVMAAGFITGMKEIGTAKGSGMYHMEKGIKAGSANIANAIKSLDLKHGEGQ